MDRSIFLYRSCLIILLSFMLLVLRRRLLTSRSSGWVG